MSIQEDGAGPRRAQGKPVPQGQAVRATEAYPSKSALSRATASSIVVMTFVDRVAVPTDDQVKTAEPMKVFLVRGLMMERVGDKRVWLGVSSWRSGGTRGAPRLVSGGVQMVSGKQQKTLRPETLILCPGTGSRLNIANGCRCANTERRHSRAKVVFFLRSSDGGELQARRPGQASSSTLVSQNS